MSKDNKPKGITSGIALQHLADKDDKPLSKAAKMQQLIDLLFPGF